MNKRNRKSFRKYLRRRGDVNAAARNRGAMFIESFLARLV